jgi:hypothetical protein
MTVMGRGLSACFQLGRTGVVEIYGTFLEGSTINLEADEDYVGAGTSVEFFEETAGSLGTDASGPPWNEEEVDVEPRVHRYYIEVDGGPPSQVSLVTVTAAPPTLTEPDGGETIVPGSTYQFTATTINDAATISLSFHVTGPSAYDETFAGSFDTDHWEFDWDTTGLDQGDYTVTAQRETASGTVESDPATVDVSAFTPSSLVGIIEWWRADLGLTVDGDSVDWVGQHAGSTLTAALANAPTVNATDATLNNLQTLSFVRANSDRLVGTVPDRPAPLTEATHVTLLMKQDAWNSSAGIWSCGTQNLAIFQQGSTPNIALINNTTDCANSGGTLNTWVLVEAAFTGATGGGTSDSLTIKGNTPSTGAAGNNNPSSTCTVGGNAALSAFSSTTQYFMMMRDRATTDEDRANLFTYLSALTGTSAPWTP